MKPTFMISIGDADITAKVRDRLISLKITDEAGITSDECVITLDNRDKAIDVPRTGARLSVAMGLEGQGIWDMGSFVVNRVRTTLGPRTLMIYAHAVDLLENMKVKKSRQWGGLTLGDLVTQIAAENGLNVRIAETFNTIDIAPVPYKQLDQARESDFHLLTRLARAEGAVFKIHDRTIHFLEAGAGQRSTGEAQDTLTIREDEVLEADAEAAERGRYKAVKAYYKDADTEERIPVLTSDQQPTYNLSRTYADQAAAERAARARLESIERGKVALSAKVAGNGHIRAEMPLIMDVDDKLIGGRWIITQAVHQIGKSFTTQIEAESPKERQL